MIRGEEDSVSIPTDLVAEILSRLPVTSIARFRCVSKQWGSMLISPYFIELFRTRSSGWPHLLFAVQRDDGYDWHFFTSPQPQNTYEKSSPLVVTADSPMKFTGDDKKPLCIGGHASGLILFYRDRGIDKSAVICNPVTGQYVTLDLPEGMKYWKPFLGFDPIEKQFKVLLISSPYHDYYGELEEYDIQILTLGAGNDSWRKIKIHCSLNHFPMYEDGICINGVLYYLASRKKKDYLPCLIVCFDVRSEKFKFINRDFPSYHDNTLINYKGKLGVITREFKYYDDGRCVGLPRKLKLRMWVLKDVEEPEPEWSKYVYTSRNNHLIDHDCHLSIDEMVVSGVTASGEIVLSMDNPYISEPFYVFYLNPERKTVKSVEIKGFGGNHFDFHGEAKYRTVKIFVEDLNFINMKTAFGDATTSISPPEDEKREPPISTSASAKAPVEQVGRKFKSINKFDSLCLLDDE
ncbi:unnamed protein product [Microthlaspi erraticum]|uniref:F-box domain-containing protein n=1 Tax=Microthlaspi erraticum TaxID=1685480 RepID=A0A6D2KJ84_9BRAS|nr:unnamed protein product [Microthlaspi erraticum]